MQVLYSVLYPSVVVVDVMFIGVVEFVAAPSAPSTLNSFLASWLHASALLITRARHLAFCLFSCLKLAESANAA